MARWTTWAQQDPSLATFAASHSKSNVCAVPSRGKTPWLLSRHLFSLPFAFCMTGCMLGFEQYLASNMFLREFAHLHPSIWSGRSASDHNSLRLSTI
jgi:hypothetical protein